MTSLPVVVNFLGSFYKEKGIDKLLAELISDKHHLVNPEDVDNDPLLAERVVGGYIESSKNSSDRCPQEFFDKLPNLKILSFLGTAVDRISLEWAKKKGLRIGHCGNEISVNTADFAFLLMAVTARKFLQIVVNFLGQFGKQKGVDSLIHEFISDKHHLVTPEDTDSDPSLVEKVVGGYLASSSYPHDRRPQEFFDKFPNLKIISFTGTGVNRISLEWAKKKGLRIGHCGNETSANTADFAFLLMAVTARKFLQCVNEGMGEKQPSLFPWHLQGHSLAGNIVGIIGMGNIGYKLAVRSHAFDMKIVYHQRNKRSEADEQAVGAHFFPNLMDMLPVCDYVIITCPLTQETQSLIGRKQFSVMKKTATLVNVARGKIVDQEALYDVLKNEEIQAAGLDVTDPEPLPRGHPLLSLPNIIITPHCGTNTFETRRAIIEQAMENMECALQGKPMPNEVLLQ